jgi:hypothetical protein
LHTLLFFSFFFCLLLGHQNPADPWTFLWSLSR